MQQRYESTHTLAGTRFDVRNAMQMAARHGVRVDEVEGCAAPCILHQSGRGIYVERCANDNQRVGLHQASAATDIMGTLSPKNTMKGLSSDPSPALVPGAMVQWSGSSSC